MPAAIKPIRWIPAMLWMAVIFTLSHMPGPQSAETSRIVEFLLEKLGIDLTAIFGRHATYIVRKTAHFTEYLILALLLRHALRHLGQPERHWWAWLLAFGYACTDEFHQLFVPRRSGSPIDVMIDGAGAGMGIALAVIWWRIRLRKKGPGAGS